MVLSNRKLKQKLREELAKSLSAAGATVPDSKSDPNSQFQSLKELLDSASHKPRFSKREKRRKIRTNVGIDGSGTGIGGKNEVEVLGDGENGGRSEETNKKKKKRKRDDSGRAELAGEGEGEGDGAVKEGNKVNKKKKKDKKKKKKKTTANVQKTPKKTVENNGVEKVGREEPKAEEISVDTESQADGIVPRKLYVGGIPYHYTEDEIRSYFKSCGVVMKVDCKMRSEDGKFSGIAFITFETEHAANRALALDRAAMGDRFLTIQQYVNTHSRRTSDFAPEMLEGYNRIYIGNLAWDITEDDIRKLFSDCVITSLRLGKNKETGEFRGYAHVDFKDSVSMAMALKLDQQIVRGRPVKISCAVPRKSGNSISISTESNSNGFNNEDTHTTDSRSVAETIEANNGGLTSTVSSGKIRRRTCYECGEKGHLSSACPKKQLNSEPTNSNTS